MGRLREKLARDKIKLDSDAGLHTLRHTFLTEAGEHTDAFTLRYIAGHDTIKTTMRYVPPSGGVGQPGVRADQSEEPSGVGVTDRSYRMKRGSTAGTVCLQTAHTKTHTLKMARA